ncbi:hypothetical protein C922_04099 [Plasmodium inui San Antonio 1]|uniref:Uncharacterized protein n=1 Tax=Plasmodium inui San Antonio 1 TaxID=1237626 RepID=W7A2M4_9APIC|nr:hypothetical protein C922_04099 [Plasmodium inui San Antonio 1]EUD65593.1 hypothetical protein C922_04099 [Plasmodium inui San Antonio 1]
MQGGNAERKNRVDAYIQRIKFSEITGHGETDKRIEYLWNLAMSTVYNNTKLSMKYITLIKKITKNTLLLDNVCCHYCNLIYIPFYNCEIKHIDQKNSIRYICFLCKRKRQHTLRNYKNKVNNAPLKNSDGLNVRSNPSIWGLFLINEIDNYAVKKETPGDQTGDVKAKDNLQGNIPLGGVNAEEDFPGDNPEEDPPHLDNNPTDEPINEAIALDRIKDLFTIDYGTSSCTIKREILPPMIQSNSCGKNNNFKNLNSSGQHSNVQKKRKHDGSIKWEEESDTVKEATKVDPLSNVQERDAPNKPPIPNRVNSAKRSNVTNLGKNIPSLGNTDNYLNLNKSKKKRKNILDIL